MSVLPFPGGRDDQDAVTMLLCRLLAFDTTSPRSNLPLLGWVAERAATCGGRARWTFDEGGEKANLLLSFGPEGPGGIVLSGHTDTVPVAGQAWTRPPFEGRAEGGRVYGRGAADMKGFIAACIAAMPAWQRANLARPIHVALSYDEELGCMGVSSLIADFSRQAPAPALVWVGEPTDLAIATSHKGVGVYRTVFHGRDAHSSQPDLGRSAIADAVRFASFLLDFGLRLAERRTRVPGLFPPHTTLNIGRIEGGAALNMVARCCAMEWECRPIPEEDVEALRATVDAYLQDAARAVRRGPDDAAGALPAGAVRHEERVFVPPLARDAAALERLRALLGAADEIAVPFGTEAGLFQRRGWPTVVCGPGSIEQAHQPDEWVAVAQLERCAAALRRLPQWLAALGPTP